MKKLKNFLKEYHHLFLSLAIIAILIDILVIATSNDLRILFLAILWIMAIIGSSEKNLSILGSLILLIASPFFLVLKVDKIADEIAIWAYVFLVIGVIQELMGFKTEQKKVA